MSQQIGLAILGFAHPHGWEFGEAFNDDPRARLVAVWDDNRERGLAAAKQLRTAFDGDLDRLLRDPAVGAVAITSEHGAHLKPVVRAAAAGKHILCEKPMATTLEDCDRMIAAIEAAGVTYMQGFQMRFDPTNRYIRDLVHGGEIGRVATVYKRHSHAQGLLGWPRGEEQWMFVPALSGGGAGMDQAIHVCDWLRWMFGEPVSVTAELGAILLDIPVEDNVAAIFRFGRGEIAILHSSWTQLAATVTTQIFGDEGSIVQMYSDIASTRLERSLPQALLVHKRGELAWRRPAIEEGFRGIHHSVAKAFIECLVDGTPPQVTADDGRKAVEMVLGIYRSARERRSIDFPLTPQEEAGA